jgi:hypothetical protein
LLLSETSVENPFELNGLLSKPVADINSIDNEHDLQEKALRQTRAAGSGMNISSPFIRRPIGTSLLTAAIVLAGIIAYLQLPVAPLPALDLPTIVVDAQLPGASPAIIASSVAAPLERQFGHIAGLTELTSSSNLI